MISLAPVTAGIILAPAILGAAGVSLFGRSLSTRVPGLLFHSLDLKSGLSLSALSSVRFREIIGYLAEKDFQSITLKQAESLPGNIATTGKLPVHITFDDGCRSVLTKALPILDHFNWKATIFPVAGYLGKKSSWDVLPEFTHLTGSEIREISAHGHEIGSHGLTHSNLTFLRTADLKTELADSKKSLEDLTGKAVTSLSFPFGSWNDRVWECAQDTGYVTGTIYRRHNNAGRGLVPVFGVYRFDSPESILARICPSARFSFSIACARIMSHFAKGAPMWKFEKTYTLSPK